MPYVQGKEAYLLKQVEDVFEPKLCKDSQVVCHRSMMTQTSL